MELRVREFQPQNGVIWCFAPLYDSQECIYYNIKYMPQITLYLDDVTETLVNQAAQASGISRSRWVAELIRQHAHDAWPKECVALAGAFPDFPLREEPPVEADVPRIGF